MSNYSFIDWLRIYFEPEFWTEVLIQKRSRGFWFAFFFVLLSPIGYFQLWYESVKQRKPFIGDE